MGEEYIFGVKKVGVSRWRVFRVDVGDKEGRTMRMIGPAFRRQWEARQHALYLAERRSKRA